MNVRPGIRRSEPANWTAHEDNDEAEDHVEALEEESERAASPEHIPTEGYKLRRSGRTIRPPKRYALLTNPASREEAVQKSLVYSRAQGNVPVHATRTAGSSGVDI